MKTLIFLILIAFGHQALALVRVDIHLDNVKGRFSRQLQGLCHDEDSVFVVQRYRVWKLPTDSLSRLSRLPMRKLHSQGFTKKLQLMGFDHMGDCDVVDGKLLIPLEGGKTAKLWILDSRTLKEIAAPDFPPERKGAGWVTVDEKTNDLLVGEFYFRDDVPHFNRIRLSQDFKTLTHIESFSVYQSPGVKAKIDRVQAVELDANTSSLYLLSDVKDGGLLKFDYESKLLLKHLPIQFTPVKEELEGLDLNLGPKYPYPYEGDIFVLMVKKTWFNLDGKLQLSSFWDR